MKGQVSNPGNVMEVLLVEDDPRQVELTKIAIAEAHVTNRLTVVESAQDALEFLHREGAYRHAPRPNLILLALDMPRRNNEEVLQDIKADPELKGIPVVTMTSSLLVKHLKKEWLQRGIATCAALWHHQSGSVVDLRLAA